MRYARSDVRGYTPPGGACPGHSEPADPDDPHFSVDCPICEPHLAADPLWAATPLDVPLTPAEEKEAETKQKEAELVTARWAQAMALAASQQVAAQGAQGAPAASKAAAKTTAARRRPKPSA